MTQALWPSEVIVSDVVGRLIEFWGFKRNLGRIWAVLYLSPEALSAEDLRTLLKLSSGAVSMSLSELLRWGVVRRVWVQGERRDFYVAEVQLWKMISRVFSERERTEIDAAIEAFEEALVALDRQKQTANAKRTETRGAKRSETSKGGVGGEAPDQEVARTLERIELQKERIGQLLDLAKLGKKLLDALLSTAKIDAEPLVRFLLGRSQSPVR